MNKDQWSAICRSLEAMPSGRDANTSWAQAQALYAMVLGALDYEVVQAAVLEAASHDEWRPSPARLRSIAAEMAEPLPGAERVHAEIVEGMERFGLYGRPDPGHPDCYLAGEPEWSHPIVGVVVRWCGGWEHLCTVDRAGREPLTKEVSRVYGEVARQWMEHTAAQLALPPGQRRGFVEAGFARPAVAAQRTGGMSRLGNLAALVAAKEEEG